MSSTTQEKSGLTNKLSLFADDLKNLKYGDVLGHPFGYLSLTAAVLTVAFIITQWGVTYAAAIIFLVIAVPFIYAVIVYPKFGIIILLVASYLIMLVVKTGTTFPVGTLMDALEVLLFIGFFLKHKYDRSWYFLRNPISYMILIWVTYNILEVANPIAESRLAWLYTVRTAAIIMFTYFIFSYYITTVEFIRVIFKIWIALSLLAALYTLKQEFFGFFSFEKRWLSEDPWSTGLYYIGGHWRKFSIFSDPVALAYNMVISSILCITLLFGPTSFFNKLILSIFIIIFFMAMLYSGTRGAFILIPAAVAFLFLLRLNTKTFFIAVFLALLFVFIIKVPASNQTLQRFQTAFRPSDDASFNVRKMNQKRIQPYIQTHPIGGGLGATGTWGSRFSPNSYLASFPPDSGYVRIAVELGWVGLFLFCCLMYTILQTGLKNYFLIKNPELKNYCLAMLLIVFALNIGNYPQEALVQFPINIFFYLIVALISVTKRLDTIKYDVSLINNS